RRETAELVWAWVIPSAVMAAAFVVVYAPTVFYDNFHPIAISADGFLSRFLALIIHPEAGGKDVLGTIGQVVPGVLGCAITVVAIIVELASNRYSSQVTDLFLRDRRTHLVFVFFVIASIHPF